MLEISKTKSCKWSSVWQSLWWPLKLMKLKLWVNWLINWLNNLIDCNSSNMLITDPTELRGKPAMFKDQEAERDFQTGWTHCCNGRSEMCYRVFEVFSIASCSAYIPPKTGTVKMSFVQILEKCSWMLFIKICVYMFIWRIAGKVLFNNTTLIATFPKYQFASIFCLEEEHCIERNANNNNTEDRQMVFVWCLIFVHHFFSNYLSF